MSDRTTSQLQAAYQQQMCLVAPMTSTPQTQRIAFDLPQAAPGSLAVKWIHGSISPKHNTDPDIQVHWYEDHTVIMRQNMAINHEAPFMFLLFGNDRVMLLDTGATRSPDFFPLRQTVDNLISEWLSRHPRPNYPLYVAHTHLHRDHFEGDSQFRDRPNTYIVGRSLEDTMEFYGFARWPHDEASFNLGGRIIDVIPSPGHEEAEVSLYDRYTDILFTGDIFYPGRLYVQDWDAFVDSINRLMAFTETHPISHILGCHIEMSIYPGKDYLIRTVFQPYERPLQMTVEQLRSLQTAVNDIGGKPGIHIFNDYIIYNGIPDRYFSYDAINPDVEIGAIAPD